MDLKERYLTLLKSIKEILKNENQMHISSIKKKMDTILDECLQLEKDISKEKEWEVGGDGGGLTEEEKQEINNNLLELKTLIDENSSQIDENTKLMNARMDTFTTLAEGSTTGDAELADGRVGADGITYNNIGDSIRNQLEEKLDENVKTIVPKSQFLLNGIGSDGSLISGLYRKVYDLQIGEKYLLIGNLTTTSKCDIFAQATTVANSAIVSDTRVPKTVDGFQKIYFTGKYTTAFVTCKNEEDFILYKLSKRPTTSDDILEIIERSNTITNLKNENNTINTILQSNINFSSKKQVECFATNNSTMSTNGTHMGSGNLKVYKTISGKYYLITGTSEFSTDYGLFAFFSDNAYANILSETLVLAKNGKNILNYLIKAPVNGKYLRISRGTYETDDIEVYEFDVNAKILTKQEIQRHKCFDDSIIKCSPFMYEAIGWKTYNPRLNILMFNDFNDEPDLLREVGEWFDYDDRFVNKTIPCIIAQGDIVWNDNTSNSTWITRAKNIVDIICNIDKPFIFCNGNHDVGQDNISSTFDVSTNRDIRYDNFFKPLLDRLNVMTNNAVVTDTSNPKSQYYYVDINDEYGHKIRCFALDESEYPLIIDTDGYLKYSMCLTEKNGISKGNNTYYSEKQMNFLVKAMQSCESDRLFILLNHINMDTTGLKGSLSGSKECLHSIIKGFKTNTDVNFTVDALEDIPSYTINATFSNKTGVHPTIHFVGHLHRFESDIVKDAGNMRRIQTMSAGTMVTGVSSSNSILRFGSDIFSMDKDFKAYFLRFGYKYQANKIGDDGMHFINEPISLL